MRQELRPGLWWAVLPESGVRLFCTDTSAHPAAAQEPGTPGLPWPVSLSRVPGPHTPGLVMCTL